MSQTNRRTKKTSKKRTKKKMPDRNGAFWQHKTAEEIIAEQKKQGKKTNVDELIGLGKGLWASDEDLDRFLEDIRRQRHQGKSQ
jgi:hypothetical protein